MKIERKEKPDLVPFPEIVYGSVFEIPDDPLQDLYIKARIGADYYAVNLRNGVYWSEPEDCACLEVRPVNAKVVVE